MKAIIFDFDGTIADTFPFVFDIVNELAPKYGYGHVSREELEELRQLPFKEIVKRYHIGPITLLRMTIDAHKANGKRIDKTKVFPGMGEVLESLKKEGYALSIMSSNSKANIVRFLKNNDLGVFDSIYTSLSPFGKAKKLRKMVQKLHFTPTETVYVGDEVRDIEAARDAGVQVVSVSWGYNTPSVLKKNNDHVAATPAEMKAQIEGIFK